MPTWEWLKGYYKKTTTKWTMKLIKLCSSTNHRPAFPAEKLITDLKMEKNSFRNPIWLKTQPNIAILQQPLSEVPLNHNFPSQKDPLAPQLPPLVVEVWVAVTFLKELREFKLSPKNEIVEVTNYTTNSFKRTVSLCRTHAPLVGPIISWGLIMWHTASQWEG